MNYVLIFFIILILGCFEIITNKKGQILKIGEYRFRLGASFLLMCSLLFLISWFRDPLYGKDSINYFYAYEDIRVGIDVRSYEAGYIFLEKIASQINLDYQAFIRLLSGLIYIPIFFVYRKRKGRTGLLLIFVAMNYLGTFSVLRSYLSVAFLLLAYDLALEKRVKGASVCAIISVLFHNLSIIYIFLLLLSRWRVNKKYWIFLIFGAAFVNTFGLQRVALTMVGKIWRRYSVYSLDASHVSMVYSIILISIILLVMINKKKLLRVDENRILINFLYYITIITLFCPWFINYTRVVRVSFIFIAILFANILSCMEQKKRYITYGIFSIILFGAMFLNQGTFSDNIF